MLERGREFTQPAGTSYEPSPIGYQSRGGVGGPQSPLSRLLQGIYRKEN